MKKPIIAIILVAIAAGVAYFAFQYGQSRDQLVLPADTDRQEIAEPQPADTALEPEPRYPVPDIQPPDEPAPVEDPAEPAAPEPLPPLTESDEEVAERLSRFVPEQHLDKLFYPDNIIKRIVATVDTLPRAKLPPRLLPVKPAPGGFLVEERNGTPVISPRNYKRYDPYIQMIEAVDLGAASSFYVRHYPLFQKAYRLLGYTGYFNDRLVDVINHLLAAPDLDGPIQLEPHINRYKYADPGLEALSAGQKILIRIGSENASIVKEELRQIRRVVTTLPEPQE